MFTVYYIFTIVFFLVALFARSRKLNVKNHFKCNLRGSLEQLLVAICTILQTYYKIYCPVHTFVIN